MKEQEGQYLTKDYKYLSINGNPLKYISSELDPNNNNQNKIGTGPNDPFLLIYNNTLTIRFILDTGTFKIYNINTQEYLFGNKDLDWVIESVEEKNNSHDEVYLCY